MESPFVAAMIETEVETYHCKREITVEGRNVPKPVREFQDVPKPVTVPLHLPPHCLRQGKGGRERDREREKKKRGRGPPEALSSHRSQFGSRILVQARRHARRLTVFEPRAPTPTGTREATGGVQPASHWPAMPLPQRGGGRKKKQGKEKKREEEGRRKKKGTKEKGKKRKVVVVSGRCWAGCRQPDKPREGPAADLGHRPLPFSLVRVNHGRQRERERKGGREREREKKKKKKKKKKRGRGPPKALPSHGSQTGSRVLVQAQWRARRLAVPEPWAPAPTDAGEAFAGIQSASHRPAMPLPQRGGERKKK